MKATTWRRSGDDYVIEWGGRAWTLDSTGGRIGLRASDGSTDRFLELSGLAATGRRADDVFPSDALVGIELFHSRVLATYSPHGWNGLTVRAAWGPSLDDDGLDLEIQASASTVGELRKLEILVGSTWASARPSATTVEPRDRGSALLSYDGREPADLLQRLTTTPVPTSETTAFAPLVIPADSTSYLEMIHPYDASRRLVETVDQGSKGSAIASVRYALFGYDLEKGVVLRGRLRGVWLKGRTADQAKVDDHRRRFLHEPPPLGN
ncbi:MAG: hypothetical protein P4L85_15975 [Paludisphaera borealis]|uniref:hypothetical protein n=1 Tax=Paludisphaera borealis TaxID=1387353 RepID=UPI00284BB823|nr:hypothetical protein [Paludisphaera borealis]MDR3620850.1 hypothetical protein [Paludisphaera borealis]